MTETRMREWWVAARMALLTLVVTGLVYPLVVTGIARVLCPDAASGSWVRDERGQIVGSSSIAQRFVQAAYLQPRPSACGYDGAASGGSNLGPTSAALRARAAAEAARLRAANPDAAGPPPAELVLASGSGLDPEVSPEAALWQAPRIAAARHADPARIAAMIRDSVDGRSLGVWGEPRVNVLEFNVRLDRELGRPALAPAAPTR